MLRVVNEGPEPVDIVVDGMRTGELAGGERSRDPFRPDVVGLAQLPGSSFYRRFREKLLQLSRLDPHASPDRDPPVEQSTCSPSSESRTCC